jgi:hypothetical protein
LCNGGNKVSFRPSEATSRGRRINLIRGDHSALHPPVSKETPLRNCGGVLQLQSRPPLCFFNSYGFREGTRGNGNYWPLILCFFNQGFRCGKGDHVFDTDDHYHRKKCLPNSLGANRYCAPRSRWALKGASSFCFFDPTHLGLMKFGRLECAKDRFDKLRLGTMIWK